MNIKDRFDKLSEGEDIKIPADYALALIPERPELLSLIKRDLSREEVIALNKMLKFYCQRNREWRLFAGKLINRISILKENIEETNKKTMTMLLNAIKVMEYDNET